MTTDATADYTDAVLFGGAGFIGVHLAHHLLTRGLAQRVWLADIRAPAPEQFPAAMREVLASPRVRVVEADVRRSLDSGDLPARADLVVNLAAVHREPGHQPREYYETNLAGAENVCAWAERTASRRIVFTSSIAPYGPSAAPRDENSLTVPATPYGGSKLAAEHIHRAWQRGGPGRRLLILRAGVVFGPGEKGNVTRLVRAVLGRYFVYVGGRNIRKAGGYVKELCEAVLWCLQRLEAQSEATVLFNFTLDPPPSVADYVDAICRVAGVRRHIPRVPLFVPLAAAYVLEALSRPLGVHQPISPTRVRKVASSNNIDPAWLREAGYPYRYTLEDSLRDWRAEQPQDWRVR